MTTSSHRPRTGVSYFGNRFLEHARRDLKTIASVCDHVVHTVSETDLYFHKAALTRVMEESRRAGLEVWVDPWGVAGVFGGESFSKYLLDHPEVWQVLSTGERVPAACVNRPAFRDFMKEWIITVSQMGAEVVFWDEPHIYFHWDKEWDGVFSCRCDVCQKAYTARHGRPMPDRLDDTTAEFRRDSLAGFLKDLMAYARHKKLKNALCLYAFEGYPEYEKIWTTLGSLPDLDVFGCDPYWRWWRPAKQDPDKHVRHYTEKIAAVATPLGKGTQVWIQAMRLPKGAEPEIGTACRAAAAAGATHITAWSFDGGALLDPVLAEDPARVWESVAKAFAELRGGGGLSGSR